MSFASLICLLSVFLSQFKFNIAGYGSEAVISVSDWFKLDRELDGYVVLPTDDSYSTDYVEWTATYDHVYPEAIVFVNSEADAQLTMKFLLEHGVDSENRIVDFRCRNCRHSLAGWSTSEGIIIDTSNIDHLYIDDEGRGIVGPGVDLYTFTKWAEENNCTLPHGDCSSVCFGGFLLGGGFGLTSRTFGMAADWINSVNVVLPNGELVTASNDNEYSDLFWGLRGAGQGNFGIVTSFEMNIPTKKQDNPGLYVDIEWPYSDDTWQIVSSVWHKFANEEAYDNHFAIYLRISPDSWLSLDYSIQLHGFWTGEQPDGLIALANLLVQVGETPSSSKIEYVAFEGWIDASATDRTRYSSHCSSRFAFSTLSDDFFGVLQDYSNKMIEFEDYDKTDEDDTIYGIPSQFFFIAPAAGSISKHSSDETAFPWRDSTFLFTICVRWMNSYDNVKVFAEDWLRNLMAELTDETYQGRLNPNAAFVNFPDNDIENWEETYYGDNYKKLQAIKAKYDPLNHFSYAYSVVPMGADEDETKERQEAQTLPDKPEDYVTLIDEWYNDHPQLLMDNINVINTNTDNNNNNNTVQLSIWAIIALSTLLVTLLSYVIYQSIPKFCPKSSNKVELTEYSPLN